MKRYVGVSLSFCVRDVLLGKVRPEQVAFIVPGFDWERAGRKPCESYFKSYWSKFSRAAVDATLALLTFRNRPDGTAANISKGIWIPEELFTWENYCNPNYRVRTEDMDAPCPQPDDL